MKKVNVEDIILQLEKLEGLKRVKHNPLTIGMWESEYFIDLNKEFSRKNSCKLRITLYQIDKNMGLETKVEMYLPSYCDWYTMFEGWLEYNEDLDNIFRMLGL